MYFQQSTKWTTASNYAYHLNDDLRVTAKCWDDFYISKTEKHIQRCFGTRGKSASHWLSTQCTKLHNYNIRLSKKKNPARSWNLLLRWLNKQPKHSTGPVKWETTSDGRCKLVKQYQRCLRGMRQSRRRQRNGIFDDSNLCVRANGGSARQYRSSCC